MNGLESQKFKEMSLLDTDSQLTKEISSPLGNAEMTLMMICASLMLIRELLPSLVGLEKKKKNNLKKMLEEVSNTLDIIGYEDL